MREPHFASVANAIDRLESSLVRHTFDTEGVEAERWIINRGVAAIPELKGELGRCHQELQERTERHRRAFHADVQAHTRSGLRYVGPGPLDAVESDPAIKSLRNRATLCGYFLELLGVNETPGFEWTEQE